MMPNTSVSPAAIRNSIKSELQAVEQLLDEESRHPDAIMDGRMPCAGVAHAMPQGPEARTETNGRRARPVAIARPREQYVTPDQ